jgi:dihydrodipicolinate synthase/N-acetylneuraminate lyase
MANRDYFEIRGVVPIVPTPFLPGGSVDWSSIPALVDFAVAAGACAICLPAYASEFYKLSAAEHEHIIETALLAARDRIPVVAQVNTPSLPRARELAVLVADMGSAAINVAVPRLFAIGEANLFRYFDEILKIVSLPMIIQDFNPGGPSMSVDFIAKLHRQHPHFRYVKLEEPMMAAKVRAILEVTSGGVGVIAGWGGMYFPELVPAGICGIMPGLAVADLLAAAWNRFAAGDRNGGFDIFTDILPQIVYSLQNMEFFHHAEKRLLCDRGILPAAIVRDATLQLSADEECHVDLLNQRVLRLLERLAMPRNPLTPVRT